MKTRVMDYIVYMLVRVFVCVIQTLPLDTCHSVSRWLAWLAADVVGLRRRVVDDNLRHVFPQAERGERRALARRMWEHLFLMVCEIAHASRRINDANWRSHLHIQGLREMVRYLLDTRPTILVSGHFGNFELGGFCLGLLGFPSYTVARPLDNPYLHRYVNRFRGAHGQFILPKQGSAGQVQQVLDQAGVLALLGDQYAGPKGCWVDFLGRPASCHKAIALLSLTNQAPMLVTYARRAGRPLQFELGLAGIYDPRLAPPEVGAVKPLTQWYNGRLEQMIRAWPAQYWWVHRRWKGQPPARRVSRDATERQDAA